MDGNLPGNFCISGDIETGTYYERGSFLWNEQEICCKIFSAHEHSGSDRSIFVEMGEFTSVSMTVGRGFTYILGMLVAGIVGYLVIRFMVNLVNQLKLRYFAFYCFGSRDYCTGSELYLTECG